MKLESVIPLRDAFLEYQTVYTNLGADYSVTDLIKPPRIVRLWKRYSKEIERDLDILKNLGSFRGNAIHDYFKKMLYRITQKSKSNEYLLETRLWDRINGRKISGAIDCLHNTELYDFKTCSVWKEVFQQYEDWENQLNLYAFLLYLVGKPVTKVNVIAWYQDWDKNKVFNYTNYPREEMQVISLPVWNVVDQHKYMASCIEKHKEAEDLYDDELPYCTKEDMWAKDDAWAVYKLTKSGDLSGKARRVLKSSELAEQWIKKKKSDDYKIIHRKGERTRCMDWCSVNQYCNQWKEYCNGVQVQEKEGS